jgi:hypothetical protein
MKFPPGITIEKALDAKRERVLTRQTEFFEFWKDQVAPLYLNPWNKR